MDKVDAVGAVTYENYAGHEVRKAYLFANGTELPDGTLLYASAPTPPEHEAEPVGWLGFNAKLREWDFCPDKPAESVIRALDMRKVYYSASSDKLRQAAEDVLNFYDVVDSVNEERVLNNLRAALDGKS